MKITNPSKAFILLVGLISVVVLMALGKVSTEAGMPVVSAVVFYGIGNGVAARSGVPVEPVIGKRRGDTE